jgi:hypothetical protein
MYEGSRFWIRLDTIWPWLGTFERVYLTSCELQLLLNDRDAGTYAPLDDLLSISPADVRIALIAQRNKLTAMMQGGAQ